MYVHTDSHIELCHLYSALDRERQLNYVLPSSFDKVLSEKNLFSYDLYNA